MKYERHPLSARYADIVGSEWLRFSDGVKALYSGRPVVLYQGKVLDGWQLYRACSLHGIAPKFAEFQGDDEAAEAFVESVNDNRRHESPESVQQHINERRDRVANAKREGKSNRVIAKDEGVDEKTIRSDLEKSTAEGSAVEPPEGKTTGKDGKKRTATPRKPKPPLDPTKEPKYCKNCTRKEKPSCPNCLAKFHIWREAKEAAAPLKTDGIDFEASWFDTMRESVQSILAEAKKAAEIGHSTEMAGMERLCAEVVSLANAWQKRLRSRHRDQPESPMGPGSQRR